MFKNQTVEQCKEYDPFSVETVPTTVYYWSVYGLLEDHLERPTKIDKDAYERSRAALLFELLCF